MKPKNLFTDPSKPVVLDLFCGLWGWSEGFIAEGWNAIGVDLTLPPTIPENALFCQRDVLTLTREWLRNLLKVYNIRAIAGSPPCQEYSYMSQPWSRAKQLKRKYESGELIQDDLKRLFQECFRIQCEASAAAARHIPLIVENVRGAQVWVGKARWHYGSFYLWGDVPALMPISLQRGVKVSGTKWRENGCNEENRMVPSGVNGVKLFAWNRNEDFQEMRREGTKGFTPNGERLGKNTLGRKYGSKSLKRKAASAMIAKIPFPLARHVARCFSCHDA